MNVCGKCRHYDNAGTHGTACAVTGNPVGYLWERGCFQERTNEKNQNTMTQEKIGQGNPCERRRGRRKANENRVDPETGATLKYCRVCGEYKPIDEFPANRTHKDGHGSECRVCHNKATSEAVRRRRAAVRARLEEQGGGRDGSHCGRHGPGHPVRCHPACAVRQPSLSCYTDRELAYELHARGWSGTLSKNLSVM